MIILAWKKVVFLSPCSCQFRLVLRAQNSSSWFRISMYSKDSSFSRERIKADDLVAMAFWVPLSRARIFFFWTKIFPKTSLFYEMAALTKEEITLFKGKDPSQAFSTVRQKPGWLSHIFSNLKGLSTLLAQVLDRLRRRGQWSELMRGRWVTFASGKARVQLGLAQHLSSLVWISPPISLRLVQVKVGPEKPRSIILQKFIQFL